MKIIVLIIFLCFALSACDGGISGAPEKIALQGMTKETAVAYSKSPNLNKISHDKLWLAKQETLVIRPELINPDPNFVVSMFDDKGREALISRGGGFDVYVDRERGKVCTISGCADIFYICRVNESREICKYFR
jgi:hypothetical protein